MPVSIDIRAITLDLDDTLWPFAPIALRIETALHAWFEQHSPQTAAQFPPHTHRQLRVDLLERHPELAHDVSRLRRLGIEHVLRESGGDVGLADAAYAAFQVERNRVDFYPDALPALHRIAARLPVAALTNGNADLQTIGIADLFAFRLIPAEHGTAKPDPGIFLAACERLGLSPEQVLHVGDDVDADIHGAHRAGLRSGWMHRSDAHDRYPHWPDHYGFQPDLIVPDMAALADWLDAHLAHRTAA